MKKATVFISTAALFAGTACGVYAESGDTATTSFDRSGHHIQTAPEHVLEPKPADINYYTTIRPRTGATYPY